MQLTTDRLFVHQRASPDNRPGRPLLTQVCTPQFIQEARRSLIDLLSSNEYILPARRLSLNRSALRFVDAPGDALINNTSYHTNGQKLDDAL